MAPPLRSFAALITLAATLSPWAGVTWTVLHLALDAHDHGAPVATHDGHGAAAALHGHRHSHGTPAHSHDSTAAAAAAASNPVPLPSLTVHPSASVASALADVRDIVCFEPSPPQPVPIILRI